MAAQCLNQAITFSFHISLQFVLTDHLIIQGDAQALPTYPISGYAVSDFKKVRKFK
jgi:hypothetical protein